MANIVIKVPHGEEEKTYTLEFTRRTIIKMEDEGIIKELSKGAKQETIDTLVYYACLKNQPSITKEEVMGIVDSISMKDLPNFVQALATLLEKSVNALEQPSEQGNAHWEVN